MIDPFGNPSIKLNNNINIFDLFNKYIKPIKGYSLLNNLSWDSYILLNYSRLQKHVMYLGNIFIKYDKLKRNFTAFHITPEYILSIVQICKKSNPKLKKIIFGLELELGSYHHTNSLIFNFNTKTINIFEPWGKNGRFSAARGYYTKIKVQVIKQLFRHFNNFNIIDTGYKYNIIGPQDNQLCNKIKNIDALQYNTLVVSNHYKNQNLVFQYSDNNYIYVVNYPKMNPQIIKIKKNNILYYPCGFDIDAGICDIYCLYYSLLVILNPSINERLIHTYISSGDIQTKVTNILQWIIQWYHYQVFYIKKKTYKISIRNNYLNNLVKISDFNIISNYNRLSSFDKKYSEIMSDHYCNRINLNQIYKWLQTHFAKKYNVKPNFIDFLIKQDSRINNKCLLFLSIKHLYDIENN